MIRAAPTMENKMDDRRVILDHGARIANGNGDRDVMEDEDDDSTSSDIGDGEEGEEEEEEEDIKEEDKDDDNRYIQEEVFPLKDEIVVFLRNISAKHRRSKRLFRTVNCPGTNRTISFKYGIQDKEADVLVFSKSCSKREWHLLRENRDPRQIWLYTTAESAYTFRTSLEVQEEGLHFNMTFGYHFNSDVYAPFGAYVPFEDTNDAIDVDVWAGKPLDAFPVAWASSHCTHGYWNRTGFVYFLSKYMDVQMYGTCGNMKIPRNETGYSVLKQHKFYLAFENSCCSGYITEKFWMALADYQAVPIVIGAKYSEYKRLAPPNSFVHADEFKSAEDLASFIKEVGENPDLYNKYHEWRKYGKVEVYTNRKVYPYQDNESACVLLDYLETNARRNKPMIAKIDPFGPDWIGGCKACGVNKWIQNFGLSSFAFLNGEQTSIVNK
ncbi:putative glycoprotein 3-alpha-L-fucosyltransferase A-like [Apostichopus japonicus]|uniref:Fucosyltransferase n=1 Tax=Stichopus japonicus TaxID=307972 RepID=A0A2G8JZ41_STIJA|nr:putative glycoprotein 3-alpha-L-fucosyltransferase A-like [Apostichopus japonicus]